MANNSQLPPIHPGEILREEFLSPLGMSANELALALRVPATRINDIVHEKRGITADTALRLSRYFGTTPQVLDEHAGILGVGGGGGSTGQCGKHGRCCPEPRELPPPGCGGFAGDGLELFRLY